MYIACSRVEVLDQSLKGDAVIGRIDISEGFNNAWQHVATFVPKFVAFLIILVIGYFVAKAIANILDRVLERVGFDRWVERGGLRRMLERSKYEPSDILSKIVFWAGFLFVLQLAFGVFGPNPISDLIHGVISFLPNIFVAILILVIAAALAKAATDLLGSMLASVSGGDWMARGAGIAILAIGFFAALDQLDIAPTIVTGLFYAILAIIVGSAVISIGVGGIPVVRGYLERGASRLESKGSEVRTAVEAQKQGMDIQRATGGTDREFVDITSEPTESYPRPPR
jgi:mechanosensitive ion channel-like protein